MTELLKNETFQKSIEAILGQNNLGSSDTQNNTQIEESEVPLKIEPVLEKKAFDLWLKSFDPKVKLTLIKEIKTLFNLGLKEAKEMVEKAPVLIKAGIPKAENDVFVEKLKAIGCVLESK